MRYAITRLGSLLLSTVLLAAGAAPAQEIDLASEVSLNSSRLAGNLVDPELVRPVGLMHQAPDFVRGYPGWYANGDVLFLHRNRCRDVIITVDDNETVIDVSDDTPLLTGHDLRFNDFETGYRVELGRTLGNGLALEGSFFQVSEWDTEGSVVTNGLLNNSLDAEALSPPIPINQVSAVLGDVFTDPFFQDVQQLVRYRSDLLSAEANLKATWKHHHFLRSEFVGIRYVRVQENFNVYFQDETTSTPTAGIGTYDVFTDNDLLGLHYGQEAGFSFLGRACVSTEIKAGVFCNGTEQRTQVVSNAVRLFNLRDTDANLAFVGELNVNASLQLARMLTMRAGYNFLWLDGLALAPEQDYPRGLTGQVNLNDNGGLFLHGFNVGLELVR